MTLDAHQVAHGTFGAVGDAEGGFRTTGFGFRSAPGGPAGPRLPHRAARDFGTSAAPDNSGTRSARVPPMPSRTGGRVRRTLSKVSAGAPRNSSPVLATIAGSLIAALATLGGVWLGNRNAIETRTSDARQQAYEGYLIAVDNLMDHLDDASRHFSKADTATFGKVMNDLRDVDLPALRRAKVLVELVGSDEAGRLSAVVESTLVPILETISNDATGGKYRAAVNEFRVARQAFVARVQNELR
jgi:hypothetical protein